MPYLGDTVLELIDEGAVAGQEIVVSSWVARVSTT